MMMMMMVVVMLLMIAIIIRLGIVMYEIMMDEIGDDDYDNSGDVVFHQYATLSLHMYCLLPLRSMVSCRSTIHH